MCANVSNGLNAASTSNYGGVKHKYLFTSNDILNCMVYCIYLSAIILFIVYLTSVVLSYKHKLSLWSA